MQASVILPGTYRPGDEDELLAVVRAPLVPKVRLIGTAGPIGGAVPPAIDG